MYGFGVSEFGARFRLEDVEPKFAISISLVWLCKIMFLTLPTVPCTATYKLRMFFKIKAEALMVAALLSGSCTTASSPFIHDKPQAAPFTKPIPKPRKQSAHPKPKSPQAKRHTRKTKLRASELDTAPGEGSGRPIQSSCQRGLLLSFEVGLA